MERRDFLTTLGAGLLAGQTLRPAEMTGPAATAATAGHLDRIGLELYAVRKAMKENPERTLAAVRAMGYTDVELLWSFNNFGRTKEQVRDALRQTGLKAPSCHMAPELLLQDWERHLETANYLGQQYLTVPSLPAETNKSLDAWKLWADRFNAAGELARRAGLWLAFHNEPNHQPMLQGQAPLEVFLQATDSKFVRLQLDVGNMLVGGGDPVAFHARYADRIGSFHLKNVVADRSHDTELGAGTFDLRAFLASVRDLDRKPCFVEQEGPVDELASAKANWDYVNGLRW